MRACRVSIALLAGQREWTDTRESWLARAAARSGLTNRTVKSLYYGDIADPEHPAVMTLREAADGYELENLATRIEELARSLRALRRARGGVEHRSSR